MSKISGFVIAYNLSDILETCLQSIRFVDELVVIDKSSTDDTPNIAERYADKYIRVPWSPTVEETRAFALEQCQHNLIAFLDDDECFTFEAGQFIKSEASAPQYDIYAFPLKHYILGHHDERAYYWPERHDRFFRRGALAFGPKVHSGMMVQSRNRYGLPLDGSAFLHHLSHADAATWIEKTNRYTSQKDRASSFDPEAIPSLAVFARERLDHWLGTVKEPDNYLEAVAILRGLYDIIDGVKRWEETQPAGHEAFAKLCASLQCLADKWLRAE